MIETIFEGWRGPRKIGYLDGHETIRSVVFGFLDRSLRSQRGCRRGSQYPGLLLAERRVHRGRR